MTQTYKVLIIGDQRSGKSSIIDRLVHRKFLDQYFPTIGHFEHLYEIKNDVVGAQMFLKLIDTSSNLDYGELPKVVFRDSSVVIFVCTLDSPKTFKNIKDIYYPMMKEMLGDNNFLPLIVMNKSELPDSPQNTNFVDVHAFCKELDTIPWLLSAKTGMNCDEFVNFIRVQINQYVAEKSSKKSLVTVESLNQVVIDKPKKTKSKKDCC